MKRVFVVFVTALLAVCLLGLSVSAEDTVPFDGKGTKAHPYLLSTAEDLVALAETVNAGEEYKDCWFKQTTDIDLDGIEWPTIGKFNSSSFFYGTYDGDGHTIKNLTVNVGGNNAFFGKLGGTVMNLGIESGSVTGSCVGSIASHTCSSKAMIVNCYNKASVKGSRAGGIADNFNGTIANCWTDCNLSSSGERLGGIVSYDAKTLVHCVNIEQKGRSTVLLDGCTAVEPKKISAKQLAQKMNNSVFSSAHVTGIDYKMLNFWTVSEDGESVVFSKEKAAFSAKYTVPFVLPYLEMCVPYVLVLLAIGGVVYALLKASQKEDAEPKTETTEPKAEETSAT